MFKQKNYITFISYSFSCWIEIWLRQILNIEMSMCSSYKNWINLFFVIVLHILKNRDSTFIVTYVSTLIFNLEFVIILFRLCKGNLLKNTFEFFHFSIFQKPRFYLRSHSFFHFHLQFWIRYYIVQFIKKKSLKKQFWVFSF